MNPLFSACEPTIDDVATVLSRFGVDVTDARAEELFDEHIAGDESVPSAALNSGGDLDEQTERANQQIALLLFGVGVLPGAVQCSQCGMVLPACEAKLLEGKHVGECCATE